MIRRFGILATISQNTMLFGNSYSNFVSVFSSPTFTTLSNSLISPISPISGHWISLVKERLPSNYSLENPKIHKVLKALSSSQVESNRDEVEFQVVTAVKSSYNDIVIVDTPESRMLLLDSTYNVHSIFNKGGKWTGSYWDEFASLPAIVKNGPIAIFGLGGGTAAHLMLDLWPSLQLEGWEIDEILIDKAREYLGLSDLEKHTQDGGNLHVRVGDALAASSTVPGGYAAIVIDLFSDGKVLPQLKEVETWLKLSEKLMPNGRFMVNCGGADNVTSSSVNRVIDPDISPNESTWEQNSTIKALCKAFPGVVSWKKMLQREGDNYLALTGPLPDFATWSTGLPEQLRSSVMQWKICSPT